jgi:hypothetical protein
MTTTNRTDAAKRAWETIRARRAAKAAGLPVPETKPKQAAKDYSALIAGWLQSEPKQEEPPAAAPVPEIVAAVQPKERRRPRRRRELQAKQQKAAA